MWTSPGDDGADGRASKYEVRCSKSLITEDNWEAAVCVDTACVPDPKPAGQIETIVIRGLDSGTRHYFALKTTDDDANESGLSNCATERTLDESWTDQCCGPTSLVCLANDEYPGGMYTLTFDFCDDVSGECLPFDWYHVFLCWENGVQAMAYVHFEP